MLALALTALIILAIPTRAQTGLVVGGKAINSSNTQLRVRSGAGLGYSQVGYLQPGDIADVLAGPIRADGYVWWQLELDGMQGWAAEGGGGNTWLMPDIVLPQPGAFYSALPSCTDAVFSEFAEFLRNEVVNAVHDITEMADGGIGYQEFVVTYAAYHEARGLLSEIVLQKLPPCAEAVEMYVLSRQVIAETVMLVLMVSSGDTDSAVFESIGSFRNMNSERVNELMFN